MFKRTSVILQMFILENVRRLEYFGLPLHLKFDLNDLVFFHKIFYNLIPVSLPSYLTIFQGTSKLRRCHLDSFSVVSSIQPRFSQPTNLDSNRSSRNPLSRSFFYRTHILWNNLPLNLRQLDSPSSFKSSLTKHLWESVCDQEQGFPDDTTCSP